MAVVNETCPCGAKVTVPTLHISNLNDWRNRHAACLVNKVQIETASEIAELDSGILEQFEKRLALVERVVAKQFSSPAWLRLIEPSEISVPWVDPENDCDADD